MLNERESKPNPRPTAQGGNNGGLPTLGQYAADKSEPTSSGLQLAAGAFAFVVMYFLTRGYPGVGFLLFIMLGAGVFGAMIGKRLQSRLVLRSRLGWAGCIAWLIPFAGVLIATAVWTGQSPGKPVTRERAIAAICFLISMTFALMGTLGIGK